MSSLSFILKLIILVAVVVWSSYAPGQISLDWADHVITISLRVFLAGFLIFLFILMALYGAYKKLFAAIRRRSEKKGLADLKAQEAHLVKALCSLELGDLTDTQKILKASLMPRHPSDLALFFSYKAASALKSTEDMEILIPRIQTSSVLQGLFLKQQIEHAISQDNYALAYTICRDALIKTSAAWLLKVGIALALKQKKFEQARAYLQEGKHLHYWTKRYLGSMTAIIYYQEALSKDPEAPAYMGLLTEAYGANVEFVPAALALAEAYKTQGSFLKAKEVLKATWKEKPSSFEVATLFCSLAEGATERARYARQLVDLAPKSVVGYILLVLHYSEAELWGEAKKTMDVLESLLSPTTKVLGETVRALLMYREKGDSDRTAKALIALMERSLGYEWYCLKCGHQSSLWTLFCDNCDAFDHLDYGDPKSSMPLLKVVS